MPGSPRPSPLDGPIDRSAPDRPADGAGIAARRRRLAANLAAVQERIAAASAASHRSPPTLVAVTKSVPVEVALTLHELGCKDLAENRADRFVEKVEAFDAAGATPTWHFIGHLQRNKARRVLEHAHVLHSVDSLRLADTVVRLAGELGRDLDAFVEVNLTGEDEKQGLPPADALEAARRLDACDQIRVLGLMVMGPLEARGHRTTEAVFGDAEALARELSRTAGEVFAGGRCQLSMGMSGDAELAVRHGSDCVRIGSSLFAGLDSLNAPEGGERP